MVSHAEVNGTFSIRRRAVDRLEPRSPTYKPATIEFLQAKT
jgi:hypothetical protein